VLHAYRYKIFAEPESRFIRRMVDPDAVVVDVGACWGSYTYWFSRAARHVIALEPNPELAHYLSRVVPDNVEVRNVAASDAAGHSTLRVPREGTDPYALATLEPGTHSEAGTGDGCRMVDVETVRLDDLALENVGLVKIDVEGHEEAVLDGARELLANHHPDLLIELEERHRPGVIARVGVMLATYGYEGCFLLGKQWTPFAEFDVERHQNIQRTPINSRQYINLFFFSARGRDRRLGESGRAGQVAEAPR